MPDSDITQVEGFAAGMNQRTLDDQKIQRAPLETQLLRAHAGKATLDLQNQEKMMQLMAQHGYGQAGQGDSRAGVADYFGDLFMQSGQPEKALKAFGEGSLMRSRAATADAATTRAVLNKGKNLVQDLEIYDRFMVGAKDQADFDARNASYFANTGKVGILAGHTWSPEVMEELTKQTLGAKDRVTAGQRALEGASRDKLRVRREQEMDTLDAYREWKKNFMKEQEARKAKVGGKAVASPTGDDQIEIGRLIDKELPGFSKLDPEGYKNAMFSEASRAAELRQQNPALGKKEALARAHTEAVKAGDYKYVQEKTKWGWTTQDAEGKYLGDGKNAATAMRIPQAKESMVKDKFYIMNDGRVGQWTGTGFSLVAEDAQDDSDDESDDEEDE